MNLFHRPNRDDRGQVLVVVAAGLVVIVAMVGLVIDGGYAWGQQRQTQNGADAIANAGATVLAARLAGVPKTDGDVGCAVQTAATVNGIANPTAFYTDINGVFLTPSVQVGGCAVGGGAAIPANAAGVKATGQRTFNTYLARVIGFNQFTATANATAVTGILSNVCPASSGCAVLPVTFPTISVVCDGTNRQIQVGTSEWPLVQVTDPAAPNYASTSNEVIVPLCTTGPGAVGWLDFGCGNLSNEINNPCNISIPIPTWLHTEPGNTNSLDNDLAQFSGPQLGVPDDSIVLIPLNDNTCNTKPPDNQPDCPGGNGSGNGNNFYYHIPKFAGFMVDHVYTSGNNPPECNSAPGSPLVGGNGSTGCFKGWFVRYEVNGPVGPGATGANDPAVIGIQLIH
jgi:Flp pilus assembly protein TadG